MGICSLIEAGWWPRQRRPDASHGGRGRGGRMRAMVAAGAAVPTLRAGRLNFQKARPWVAYWRGGLCDDGAA